MKKPEHKRQSPWQKGKSKDKTWEGQAWDRSMAPWVKDTLVEKQKQEKDDNKKKRKRNKGKKRIVWFAKQMALWHNFGTQAFEVPQAADTPLGGSSSAGASSSAATSSAAASSAAASSAAASGAASSGDNPSASSRDNSSLFKEAYNNFDELLKPVF